MMMRPQTRVIVDPNSVSQHDPNLTTTLLEDAEGEVTEGEWVYAVQPDEDGSEYVGLGFIQSIDKDAELIYVRVYWDSFSDWEPKSRDFNVLGGSIRGHGHIQFRITGMTRSHGVNTASERRLVTTK